MTKETILSKRLPGGLDKWKHGTELDAALKAVPQGMLYCSLEGAKTQSITLTVMVIDDGETSMDSIVAFKAILDKHKITYALLDLHQGIFAFSKIFTIVIEPIVWKKSIVVDKDVDAVRMTFEYFNITDTALMNVKNVTSEHLEIARTQAFAGMLSASGLRTLEELMDQEHKY